MSKQIESSADPAFGSLFTSFEHTAYRLETLQRYTDGGEQEPLRRFMAGERQPADPDKDAWVSVIRNAAAHGRKMQRVHVVAEPPSDYIRYELSWSYRPNVAAGEDIRILPTAPGTWPAGLPRADYWLFDSRELWIMEYDDTGAFSRADLLADPAEIVRHCYWRDAALHAALPYAEYMAQRADMYGQSLSGSRETRGSATSPDAGNDTRRPDAARLLTQPHQFFHDAGLPPKMSGFHCTEETFTPPGRPC